MEDRGPIDKPVRVVSIVEPSPFSIFDLPSFQLCSATGSKTGDETAGIQQTFWVEALLDLAHERERRGRWTPDFDP